MNKELYKNSLKTIRKRMQICNWFFHFTRNNPRTRDYFYYAVVGLFLDSDWEQLKPAQKSALENARLSFDKLYGLVKAWSKFDDFSVFVEENPKLQKLRDEISALKENDEKEISKLEETVEKLNKLADSQSCLSVRVIKQED